MDERKIDSAVPRAFELVELSPSDSAQPRVNEAVIRIDGRHSIAEASDTALPNPAAISLSFPNSTNRVSSQLLLDAGLLVQQMQEKLIDLSQREGLIEQRAAELDAERFRDQSLRLLQIEELEQRRRQIQSEETSLHDRVSATASLLEQVDAERSAVEQRQLELRDNLLAERHTVEQERRTLLEEQTQVRRLAATLEEQHRQATVEAEKLIQSERERLWRTLIAEWEERRSQFEAEHETWRAEAQAERLEIEREKTLYDAAVCNAESVFAAARATQTAELSSIRETVLASIEIERQAQRALIEEEQIKNLETIQTERRAHESSLRAERDEWEKTYATQRAQIDGERTVLESRVRFQEEHLEKLRVNLERSQNENRHQLQIERRYLEDNTQLLLRRTHQNDLYRESIDARETSIQRERDFLTKSRLAHSSTTDLDRIGLQTEREAWEQERQIQQAELRRQQELFTSHSENLESRRIRLDKLRGELEETHRSTLEMRMAIEETWVDLTQSVGPEDARERVEKVRSSLVGYYRQLHDEILVQRREHLEAQSKLERLRADFHDERHKLMDWIATRDKELLVTEERLRLESTELVVRDSAWQMTRDRWLIEKAEAEQVIRRLLMELGSQHRDDPQFLASSTICASSAPFEFTLPAEI